MNQICGCASTACPFVQFGALVEEKCHIRNVHSNFPTFAPISFPDNSFYVQRIVQVTGSQWVNCEDNFRAKIASICEFFLQIFVCIFL
jgi:hypothetical protein